MNNFLSVVDMMNTPLMVRAGQTYWPMNIRTTYRPLFKAMAAEEGIPMIDLIDEALEAYLRRRGALGTPKKKGNI